jgi:uncharacterized protein (TIGR01777 family)
LKQKLSIKITGISGYLGNLISNELIKNGHNVSGINRALLYTEMDALRNQLSGSDIVINLAGAPILQRWNKKNRAEIYNSRVTTTQNLVKAIRSLPKNHRPRKFISASAIGIYKANGFHDENSTNFDTGFVGEVVKNWENQSDLLPDNVQKIIFRIGLVLGKKAKTIQNLLLPFKLGLGATIGNGKQPFPFIHETDVARAFLWAAESFDESSTFNLTAPETITNEQFTQALAKNLHRPAFFFIPGFVFKIILGDAAVLITQAPSVSSAKLSKKGFTFDYPDIGSAIKEITR